MTSLFKVMFFCILFFFPLISQSEEVMGLYEAAKANDSQFRADQFDYEALIESENLASAALKPKISLSQSTQVNDFTGRFRLGNSSAHESKYNSNVLRISINQPLFDLSAIQGKRVIGKKKQQADIQFSVTETHLIVKVIKAYFGFKVAEKSLAMTRRQLMAAEQQLKLAKQSFESGLLSITDVYEVESQRDILEAKLLVVESEFIAIQSEIENFTQVKIQTLDHLNLEKALDFESGAHLIENWIHFIDQSPQLLIAQYEYEASQLEVKQSRGGYFPTIDLFANYSKSKSRATFAPSGTGPGSDINSKVIGLTVNIPLYSGGATRSRVRQSIAKREASLARLDENRKAVDLFIRTTVLKIASLKKQVAAYLSAEKSSKAALASVKKGYEVGARISLDVLQAQNQADETELHLLKTRINYLFNIIQLKGVLGQLSLSDLKTVDQLFYDSTS